MSAAPPEFGVFQDADTGKWRAFVEYAPGDRQVSPLGSEAEARAEAEACRVQYQRFLYGTEEKSPS